MRIYFDFTEGNRSEEVFNLVYKKYKNMVWYIVCKIIPNDICLCEEVTQDIFVKFFMTMGSIQSEKAAKKWLCIVAKNTALDAAKKRSVYTKHMEIVLDDCKVVNTHMDISEDMPYEELLKKETSLAVAKELNKLKPVYYEALFMRYSAEFTPQEISERLNISLDSVYSRLRRARNLMEKNINVTGKERYMYGGGLNERK